MGLVGTKQLSNKMKKFFFVTCLLLGSVATFAQRDLGYRGFVDLGGGIGITPGSRFMVGLSTVHGYQAAPFLFFGVGIAANDIAWKSKWRYGETKNDGIVYLNPSIGIHYAKSDNFGFNLSVGYDHQGTKNDFYWDGKEKKSLGYISMKFGIDF